MIEWSLENGCWSVEDKEEDVFACIKDGDLVMHVRGHIITVDVDLLEELIQRSRQ